MMCTPHGTLFEGSDQEQYGGGGGGACDWYREWRDVYTLLLEKLQGKRRLGGPSRRWEDNIKLKAGGCGLD